MVVTELRWSLDCGGHWTVVVTELRWSLDCCVRCIMSDCVGKTLMEQLMKLEPEAETLLASLGVIYEQPLE